MSLLERIFYHQQGVANSAELDRIVALPRRTLDLDKVPDLTPLFRLREGKLSLKPIQSAALLELEESRGGFFPIGVGYGKTLISLLAADVLHSKRPVLLVPPQLRDQLRLVEIPKMAQHFRLPKITIVAYSELSIARGAHLLEELNPDLIIADEAHNLRKKTSTRTKRVIWFMRAHPECRFVALSGTMTSKSIKDYAHLCEGALRERSPLPRKYQVLEEWAAAIDTCDYPLAPGALTKLFEDKNDNVRRAFGARLRSTAGVVSTSEGAIGTSLRIHISRPELPTELGSALDRFRSTWELAGEDYTDAVAYARVSKQIALGFYYRWDWPNDRKDEEWLEARSAWHREIRAYLSRHARPGLDSPLLYTNAVEAGTLYSDTYSGWKAVESRPKPPTVAVWIDKTFLQKIVCDWVNQAGIIWYSHQAVGELLENFNIPNYGAGSDRAILSADPTKTIACSIAAHGTGKNLQAWSRNLFLCCPSSGATWEQALARTHRPGQEADEVTAEVLLHTPELVAAWESSLADADYIETTTGVMQKLKYATILDGVK